MVPRNCRLPPNIYPAQVPKVDFSLSRAHGAADGSDSEILCLAFVEVDAPILASAGNDLVVRCWSLRNHTCTLLSVLEVSASKTPELIDCASTNRRYIRWRLVPFGF